MTSSAQRNSAKLSLIPPLLMSESQDHFASICDELEQEIRPSGVIERIYVQDIANIICEIQRFRRYKTTMIYNSYLVAVRKILLQLLRRNDFRHGYQEGVEDLARRWFSDEKAKAKVAKLLRKFQMDEAAFEAEAFRVCSEDLERLDRILTALEFRRDKALRAITEYRQIFSKQLQQAANRILDNDEVPRLAAVGNRSE